MSNSMERVEKALNELGIEIKNDIAKEYKKFSKVMSELSLKMNKNEENIVMAYCDDCKKVTEHVTEEIEQHYTCEDGYEGDRLIDIWVCEVCNNRNLELDNK